MKIKHYFMIAGIIIIFIISFIIYDQTRYTTFEKEFTEIQDYYSNHGDNWNISEIELASFDRKNNKGYSKVIDDPSTIDSISNQLMKTELKKTSTSNEGLEKTNFTLRITYSDEKPATGRHILHIHIHFNRIYISEPFLHATYEEVESNQFYSFLEGLDLSWDREFQLSNRE